MKIAAVLALVASAIFTACSSGRDTAVGGQQSYSFRSDPDSEFLRSDAWTGGGWVKHESIIYTNGRFKYSVTSQHTNETETYETQISMAEMEGLLRLITASGLMKHDHKRARVADRRNLIDVLPARDRLYLSSDGRTVKEKITIRLSEDHCPGRRPQAPITVQIEVNPRAASSYPDVPELQAAAALSATLNQHRDKLAQPRTLEPH